VSDNVWMSSFKVQRIDCNSSVLLCDKTNTRGNNKMRQVKLILKSALYYVIQTRNTNALITRRSLLDGHFYLLSCRRRTMYTKLLTSFYLFFFWAKLFSEFFSEIINSLKYNKKLIMLNMHSLRNKKLAYAIIRMYTIYMIQLYGNSSH